MVSSEVHTRQNKSCFLRGVIAALVGAILWGFSGNCIQLLVADANVEPLFITAIRALVASIVLIVFVAFTYYDALRSILRNKRTVLLVAVFGCALFGSQATYAISVEQTNAGTATILQSLAVVFVMLFACITKKRLPKAAEALGLLCAIASTWLIATHGDFSTLSLPLSGLVWGLLNALAVTIYIICPERLYARYPSMAVIACGVSASALFAIGTWLVANTMNGSIVLPVLDAYDAWLLIGGIGILGTALAFGLYLYGVSMVGSVNGSLLGTAEPASAMVLMVVWLGVSVTAADWAGLILMIAMIVLVALSGRNNEKSSSAPCPHER